MKAPRATEADCQRTIVQTAAMFGWLVHAERPAQNTAGTWRTAVQGHTGFPDLVLVRAGELLVIECKRRPNRVEPAQARWHDELRAAGIEMLVVWVPEELPALLERLGSKSTVRPALEVQK